jgi:hypothetical protein
MAIPTAVRQDAVKLHTLLQDKPWNMLLKRGELQSPTVQFDFDDVHEASDLSNRWYVNWRMTAAN